MESWIVFDAMGVIFVEGDDDRVLLDPFIRRHNPAATPETIRSAYREASLGQISPAEFWEAAGLGGQYPDIERTYLDTCPELNPELVPTLDRLAVDYKLAILSNDIGAWSAYLRVRHGLDRYFGEAVISGDVGCRKPDRGIYSVLLERIGVPAERCLFVDDREANLVPARALGMQTVFFRPGDGSAEVGDFRRIRNLSALPRLAGELLPIG
jgi:putative hydrolase of the HAD superfamily